MPPGEVWKDLRPSEQLPANNLGDVVPRFVDPGDGNIVGRLVDIGVSWREWELAPAAVRKSLRSVLHLLGFVADAILKCLQLDDLEEQPSEINNAPVPSTPAHVEDQTRRRARQFLEGLAATITAELANKSSFLRGRPRTASVEALVPEVDALVADLKRLRHQLRKLSPVGHDLSPKRAAEMLRAWLDDDWHRMPFYRPSVYRACVADGDLDRIRLLTDGGIVAFARELVRRASSVSDDDLVRKKPRTRKRTPRK